jgi:hypothetical protein
MIVFMDPAYTLLAGPAHRYLDGGSQRRGVAAV